jgi:hypothetical protein
MFLRHKLTKKLPHLGSGSFASVHKISDDEVMKICNNVDDASRLYYEWIISLGPNHNYQWVPKIHRLIVYDTYYIVFMKRYRECTERERDLRYDYDYLNLLLVKQNQKKDLYPTISRSLLKPFNKYIQQIGFEFETMTFYHRKDTSKRINYDLHAANIMWDDDIQSMILTDPVCGTIVNAMPPLPLFKKRRSTRKVK